MASLIIPTIRGCDIQKWNLKYRGNNKTRRAPNAEGIETQYNDLDGMLAMIVEEFKGQRKTFQKDLQK